MLTEHATNNVSRDNYFLLLTPTTHLILPNEQLSSHFETTQRWKPRLLTCISPRQNRGILSDSQWQIFHKVTFLIKTFWLAEWLYRRVHTWQWPSLQILSCTLTRIGFRQTAGRLAAEKTIKWKMMFAEGTCENIPFRLITTKRLSSLNRSPKTPSGYHVNQMWLRAPCAFHQCKCHARPCKWSFLGRVSDLLSVVFC